MKYTIGIDLGGTKCVVLLGKDQISDNIDDFIIEKHTFETCQYRDAKKAMQHIFEQIDSILESHSLTSEDIEGIGISCGGPLDSAKGVILNPPNLYGWQEVPVCRMLKERYPVRVRLENDANACAVAEARFGAARGCKNIVFLTFGTGMGAGIIVDGRLYSGTNNMAGEIGHVRLADFGPVGYGKAGSFEGFCSGGGIAQIAQIKALEYIQQGKPQKLCTDRQRLNELTAKDVAIAAENGDELALEIFRICGAYLGKGISVLIDVLNPEIIVLGSVYQRSGKFMREVMEDWVERESLARSKRVCRIEPAVLGDNIGDYAALSLALLKE